MWKKTLKTKVGIPIVIDQHEKKVVVFIDYPSQTLIVSQDVYDSVEAAEVAMKEKIKWVEGFAA